MKIIPALEMNGWRTSASDCTGNQIVGKYSFISTETFGAVSDLLVIILGSIRFHEVKSLNVRLRIRSVIKNAFLQFYKHSK